MTAGSVRVFDAVPSVRRAGRHDRRRPFRAGRRHGHRLSRRERRRGPVRARDRPRGAVDIAGTAQNNVAASWLPKGATGFGARLLIRTALNFAPLT
jgi:hypothetical protein